MFNVSKRGRRYLILTCFLLVIASLGFSLCIYFTARILQQAQDGDLNGMIGAAEVAVGFLAIKFAVTVAAKWANLKFLSEGTVRMRDDIMKSIFGRPLHIFRKQNDAYYLNLLGSDTDIYASERLGMIPWIFSGITDIVIYVIALYLINPWLMIACAVLSTLPLLTSNIFTKIIQKRKHDFSIASEQFTEALKEGIEGYEPIRMGGGAATYIERFVNACRKKQEAYSASGIANTVSMQTLYATAIILNIGCTVVGGLLLLRGMLPLAMIFAAVSYSGNLSNAFTNIAEYVITIRATKKIAEKLQEESFFWPHGEVVYSGAYDIVYDKVSFGFDERQLYQEFSYHFKEKGCYAIIGESGSGKSTLIKLLLKYYDDYTGTIKLSGCDVRELPEDEVFNIVGVVEQQPFLFNASLYENIMIFGRDIEEDSNEYRKLLKDVNLTDLAQRVGDKPLGDFGDSISGGERQRISLARTMRRHPRIVLFDEPTTGLDPENVRIINDFIFSHNDMLRIVIGHNWDENYLKHFDDVIRINF